MEQSVTLTAARPGLETGGPRVLVVVRDARLRSAVDATLRANGMQVVHCDSIESVGDSIAGRPGEVVLLDWSKTAGLLTEGRRGDMRELCRQTPVVLLVPERWMRLVSAEELGVLALLPKTSGMASLLEALAGAAGADARAPT
jgi:DNA-binding NtrC family response regulator